MSDKLAEEYFRHLDSLAPAGNSFGFHIRFSRPQVQRLTYAKEWTSRYSAKTYVVSDPTLVWGMMNTGAIRWSEIPIPDTLGVLADAAAHGITYGVVIAHGDDESKTIGSCSRADREFTDEEIREIQEIVVALHDVLDVRGELKPHQVDALRVLAEGLTYDEACAELSLSRTAFRNRLAGARRALGAENNNEAVRLAIEKGHLPTDNFTGMAKSLPAGRDA